MDKSYENFILDVFDYKFNDEDSSETFKVRVLDSPAGQRGFAEATTVRLPAEVRESFFGLDKRMLSRKELIALGTQLADVLFPNHPSHCREMLERSRPDARSGFDVLRIQLRLNALELSNIPWEFVYIPRPGTPAGQEDMNGFLALDRSLSLVRFEQLRQAAGALTPSSGQSLRMVLVTANPDQPPYQKLAQIDTEIKNIGEIVKEINFKHNGLIRYETFEKATVDKLVDAFAAPADIFHFAGHGRFKKSPGSPLDDTGGAIVLLSDDEKDIVEYGADKLAGLLRSGGDSGVKLAVLGACEVGRRDGVNAWTGVVPALIRAGIPAVVGMQFKIGDKNAKEFSRAFYRALAEGQAIDDAVALGRQAIYSKSSDSNERDWGTPVLYLRTVEGMLFPKRDISPEKHAKANSVTAESLPVQESLPPPIAIDKVKLRDWMTEHLNTDEMESVCLSITQKLADNKINTKLDLDTVGGNTKTAKALNLIAWLDRRGWLSYLVLAIRETEQFNAHPI